MADVFISYAREDRAKAQQLAKVLEEKGWSVWWDPEISPGKTPDEVIAVEEGRNRRLLPVLSDEV